jgi:hypothetical protein
MSWDVDIQINTGRKMYTVEDVGNYTYNVSPMYKTAMDMTISDFDGMLCEKVKDIVIDGLVHMAENEDDYKELNPSNGWGNYDGAVRFLEKIYEACLRHPKATVIVS